LWACSSRPNASMTLTPLISLIWPNFLPPYPPYKEKKENGKRKKLEWKNVRS